MSTPTYGGGHICSVCHRTVINGQVCDHAEPEPRPVRTVAKLDFRPHEIKVREAADNLAREARKLDPLKNQALTDALDEYDMLIGGGICG